MDPSLEGWALTGSALMALASVPPSVSPQYLILMLIIYIFECASCITSYTHRDYVSPTEARGGT